MKLKPDRFAFNLYVELRDFQNFYIGDFKDKSFKFSQKTVNE